MRVDIKRKPVVAPISEVVLTLSEEDALRLIAVLGSMHGGDNGLYKALRNAGIPGSLYDENPFKVDKTNGNWKVVEKESYEFSSVNYTKRSSNA